MLSSFIGAIKEIPVSFMALSQSKKIGQALKSYKVLISYNLFYIVRFKLNYFFIF